MESLPLDHVGMVVPDIADGIGWYTETLGLEVAVKGEPTEVNGRPLGLRGTVVVEGALLRTASPVFLHLQQYHRPTGTYHRRFDDLGHNHFGFWVYDLPAAYATLQGRGMKFFGEPRMALVGSVAGHISVMGADLWGNVVELRTHASPKWGLELGLDHAGLVVPSLERARSWYLNAFGWDVKWHLSRTDIAADVAGLGCEAEMEGVFLNAGGGYVELHKSLSPESGGGPMKPCCTRVGHIGVRCPDIGAAFARLRKMGASFVGEPSPRKIEEGEMEGWSSINLIDPFGNVVELTQRPKSFENDDDEGEGEGFAWPRGYNPHLN